MDWPARFLSFAVRRMPAERNEWGAAMLAELSQLQHPATRWQFALSCTRVALFPPDLEGHNMLKDMLFTLTAVTLIGWPLLLPETGGIWLAYAITSYIWSLVISSGVFGNLLLLVGMTWGMVCKARGLQPRVKLWAKTPPWLRRGARLFIEIIFGLLNPVLYLTILSAALPLRRPELAWWYVPLQTLACVLLVAIWGWRIGGASFSAAGNPASRAARLGLRILLLTALVCLLTFAIKDVILLAQGAPWSSEPIGKVIPMFLLVTLGLSPLYLIPGLLLCDYLRASVKHPDKLTQTFLLLTGRASRIAVAGGIGIALVAFALAAQRRSETNVRKLVSQHRTTIQAAAARYDTDPRLIAAIVYVTHRDQLSPLRDNIEQLFTTAWGMGQISKAEQAAGRFAFLRGSKDFLNHALDLSIGIAQIKPRTALTASELATNNTPTGNETTAHRYSDNGTPKYSESEPLGAGWPSPLLAQIALHPAIPAFTERRTAVQMLRNDQTNLETCALILALYQKQWEVANRDWSIRTRPDILATLYQIGFARSKPHGAPRSNAFGTRVREVYEQPWLGELVAQK